VALRPTAGLLAGVLALKVGTEALFPLSGAPVWEVVERAGSYVAPLSLAWMVRRPAGATLRPRLANRALAVAAALAAATVAATLHHAEGAPAALAAHAPADTSLLGRLRAGGLVLACRHAITDRSRGDARRFDLADRSTQRLLSPEGEAQARRLGEVLRSRGIPIGEVLTSPVFRAADSAELAFGRAEASDLLWRSDPGRRSALRELLATPPPDATNRVLMTHQGVLYDAIPALERGSIREGDCVVVEPARGDGFEVLARLGPDDFAALRAGGPDDFADLRAGGPDGADAGDGVGPVARAVAAARAGGTSIVCRHARTDATREVEPVDYDDPSTQRRLSAEGERQSRSLGRSLRALGVEIDEAVASPMQRARRTAELVLGRPAMIDSAWHTNGGSYGGAPRDRRARLLSTPIPRANRLVVSHIGTMASVLPDVEGSVREGDCVVVRPTTTGYDVLGIVPWDAWRRPDLAPSAARESIPTDAPFPRRSMAWRRPSDR
jgi:phosphohistidine phosphatase SixA